MARGRGPWFFWREMGKEPCLSFLDLQRDKTVSFLGTWGWLFAAFLEIPPAETSARPFSMHSGRRRRRL